MKYPLREPLRHDNQTLRPPGEVELDPKTEAEDIALMTRLGVIGAPGEPVELPSDDEAGEPGTGEAAESGSTTTKG